MENEEELTSLIKLWSTAIFSICYCYTVPPRLVIHGVPKLLSLLPIIIIFFFLPLPISTVHLILPTFFYLIFLCNFKLLLFAFNNGPLSSTPPLPILDFITIALLPIIPKQPGTKPANRIAVPSHKPILLALKALVLALIISVYKYREILNKNVIIVLYLIHMYLGFELSLASAAYFVKVFPLVDIDMEPQFNEPYLATSIQDFWGRRWNRVASGVLRGTVHVPVRALVTPYVGRLPGQMVAIFATFVVSGVLHELMYLYMMRVPPTWEVTWFFVLHGVCAAAEVAVKKKADGRFRLHWAVSWPLTLAFVVVTSGWLFFAQPLRNGVDLKVINEYSIFLKYLGLVAKN